jgi:hypothetical protein
MTDAEHRSDGDRRKATLRETRDWGRMVRRRSFSSVAAVALLASLAACVSTKANQPPSSPSIPTTIVSMGQRVETTAGNIVVVYSFLPSFGKAPGANMVMVAADIQACAGAHPSLISGVQRTLFVVETPDQHAWPSVEAVKKPELKPTLFTKPGQCVRGWVTFSIPKAQKPAYVVLSSSALVKWKIP